MITKINWFGIENLMYYKGKNKKMMAPPEALHFAREMTFPNHEAFNRLAKIWFEDKTIFQYKIDGELTSHEVYMIGDRLSETRLTLTLWVDEGDKGVPVARAYQTKRDIYIMQAYEEKNYYYKPSKAQIQEIFNYLFDNPNRLEINRFER
ncbi:hypothetical protein SAMN05421841_1810 [Chryseobacterium wanjuense]|uniref:Uncharacterized protein n=1 Tax=Chryseobacterium wanjuense TaxID=356305 RepID=A0A1I0QCH8_9FLAO|nr:hypothetical protein [Chryseobacterium wanjuense]SEW24637.1 hypothetical protein SAMN05421841_1810 [Chryseobacterium wanjuense]